MSQAVVVRREVLTEDGPFIAALLLADARAQLALLPDPIREQLAVTQVSARAAGYASDWPDAQDSILLIDGAPVGRLLLSEADARSHVVDFRLAADSRGQGVGTVVLARLCADADRAGVTLSLEVDADNSARRLYERAGFVPGGKSPDGLRLSMIRPPSAVVG